MSISEPQFPHNTSKWDKITKIALFLFIFSLFFPTRHVFLTKNAYLTGEYSDFTAISLYSSDILLILLVLLLIPRGKELMESLKPLKWLFFWLIIAFLGSLSFKSSLSTWYLIKFLELIVAYGTMVVLFKKSNLKSIFFIFAGFTALEAILALFQFTNQAPLGLFRLGEQHLDRLTPGFAKIILDGVPYLRGYGTFPHPNPLSAFLVTGILITTYLLINAASRIQRIALSLMLAVNIFGLTVTFSRGAYLAIGIGLLILFGLIFWKKHQNRATYFAMIILLISITGAFITFKPFLLTRATFSDQSTIDRIYYDNLGIKMIKTHPLFGVGLGESVLRSSDYSNKPLAPWEKQPPHNYFLLAGAEIGILGALILFWIFIFHLKLLWLQIKSKATQNLYTVYCLLFTILVAFLVLMMFDHYFYTLEQTQLLLWIMLGIIASQKNPSNEGNLTS